MPRVKTFSNGGTVSPADINLIQDDTPTVWIPYATRFVTPANTALMTGSLNGKFVPFPGISDVTGVEGTDVYTLASTMPITYGTSGALWFERSALGDADARCRMSVAFVTGTSSSSFIGDIALYPVLAMGGGVLPAGIAATVSGTPVAGSAVRISNPQPTTPTRIRSSEFAPPLDGMYVMAITGLNANALTTQVFHATLELGMRS